MVRNADEFDRLGLWNRPSLGYRLPPNVDCVQEGGKRV